MFVLLRYPCMYFTLGACMHNLVDTLMLLQESLCCVVQSAPQPSMGALLQVERLPALDIPVARDWGRLHGGSRVRGPSWLWRLRPNAAQLTQ
jgi:hypothetical protein